MDEILHVTAKMTQFLRLFLTDSLSLRALKLRFKVKKAQFRVSFKKAIGQLLLTSTLR